MSSNVDRIKERLNIVDVVGSYIKLERAGSNLKAKCPFHTERTPSFFVSPERGTYYCFGCQAKGDIFTFVQEFEGLDFPGALKILAHRAGIELTRESQESRTEKDKLLQVMEVATIFFEGELQKNPETLNYLKKRGVKAETLKEWRIGFAPLDWQETLSYLKQKGFPEDDLKKAGLVKEAPERPGRFYDVFRGRIIFPVFDQAGRSIAFSGRLLVEEKEVPKYLNSPETPLFNKSEVLYGLQAAKSAIRKKNYSILVEGQMDLILSHQEGFNNTVASSGTALTLNQLSRLNRLSPRIIFAYDGDEAGLEAADRSAKLALSLGMNVKIVPIPAGEDPASLLSQSKEKYSDFLKKSSHIIDFHLERLLSSGISQRKLDQELKERILPLVKILPSSIDQARFIGEIAEKTSVRAQALWDDLGKVSSEDSPNLDAKEREQIRMDRKEMIASKIMGVIVWREGLENPKLNIKEARKRLTHIAGEKLISGLGDKEEAVFEAEAYYTDKDNLEEIVEDLFVSLEEEILRWQFSDIMRELSLAERAKDLEKTKSLLSSCREIGEKINTLSAQKARRFLNF
ncbi:MAG: DNA primase [Parcubacteria group bacterium Gr01-1014_107]|nr:MAG: DNA primase [Parcubacteria group bacterium Gr01-1014_107]